MADAGGVERLQLGDHVCAIVGGDGDRLDVMARTVAAGLAAGQKVMLFTHALSPAAVRDALDATVRGVPAPRPGQVQVLAAREAYLPDDRFEPARMLSSLVDHIDRAAVEGYHGVRLVGDMTWAQTPGAALLAYETEVNRVYLDGGALGICLYDRRGFDRTLLQRIACAHPAATGGTGADAVWAPLLRMRRTTRPHGLRLTGEADLSNRQAVATAFDTVLDQHPDPLVPIVVDVAGLRFADAATAALLGRLNQRAPAGLHVTGCHGALATVLDQLGVARLPAIRVTRAA